MIGMEVFHRCFYSPQIVRCKTGADIQVFRDERNTMHNAANTANDNKLHVVLLQARQ